MHYDGCVKDFEVSSLFSFFYHIRHKNVYSGGICATLS